MLRHVVVAALVALALPSAAGAAARKQCGHGATELHGIVRGSQIRPEDVAADRLRQRLGGQAREPAARHDRRLCRRMADKLDDSSGYWV